MKKKLWFCGSKLFDEGGQRRMSKLVQANRKARVFPIITLYNQGKQKSIS